MSEPRRRYTFPRSHRLSGKDAFARVFDAKVKESRGPLTMFALPNGLPHPRLGLSVSRRVGSAPRRNRIKRLLREAFRHHQHDLPRGYDLVISVRPHRPALLADYQRMMTALMLKLHGAWGKRDAEARRGGDAERGRRRDAETGRRGDEEKLEEGAS